MKPTKTYTANDTLVNYSRQASALYAELTSTLDKMSDELFIASDGIFKVCHGPSSVTTFQLYHSTGSFAEAKRVLEQLADPNSIREDWANETRTEVCYNFRFAGALACVILHSPCGNDEVPLR